MCAVLVAHVGGGVLVDAVVGEVDHAVPNVSWIIAVRNGGKPDQPIFIDIELHRVNTGQKNIEAEIKLQPIDEEWVGNILLDTNWIL